MRAAPVSLYDGTVVVGATAAVVDEPSGWACDSLHISTRSASLTSARPAPVPSSAANGPQGCGAIQTCTMALPDPARTEPTGQLPLASVTPPMTATPAALRFQHKLSCICHCIKLPAKSSRVGSSMATPVLAINMADTSVRLLPSTLYTRDSGAEGSRNLSSSISRRLM
ncbi:MAG: hypothetical protein RIS69_1684 [Actinomycetota bacterium]